MNARNCCLYFLSKQPSIEVELICTNLKTHGPNDWDSISLKRDSILYADALGSYVYEPNASLMKAGVFAYITDRYGVYKLHPNSHLFTSNDVVPHFSGPYIPGVGHPSLPTQAIQ